MSTSPRCPSSTGGDVSRAPGVGKKKNREGKLNRNGGECNDAQRLESPDGQPRPFTGVFERQAFLASKR
ncbi:hypothetical protein AMECASPLE_021676 [Ameca splendens]|uniref:Uncharacterized protein n=1 Tax=Ameca splendens TaxID=208324 RepID=A0ABV0Z2I6_9TELE